MLASLDVPTLPASHLDRTLHWVNSALVFWFLAFLITGPKASYATSALLLLSLATLPITTRTAPRIWKQASPWLVGLGVYCAYQIIYRLIDGGLDARTDPPARYLGAIPIVFYLSRYGFRIEALWAGLSVGCIIGGAAGMQEVLVDGASRAQAGHHPIAYGSLLALMSMTGLYFASVARTHIWRALLAAGVIAGLIGVLLSGTRGLYPALAACFAYIGYRQIKRLGIPFKAVALIVCASLAVIIAIASQIPAVQKRFEQTQSEYSRISKGSLETSFGHRLQMWHAGLYIISQRPLLGLGPDVTRRLDFAHKFMEENKHNKSVLTRYDHLHNLYLNEAATYGLLGLAALATLLYGALGGLKGDARNLMTIIVLIILVEGLTETVLNHHRFMMAFVMLATMLRASQLNCASPASQTASGAGPAPR